MIHTKLLIRRLAYVPWLLAAGLVLGWAGEAAAQTAVTLTLDKKTVREDASSPVTITAKAKVAADAAAAINVTLSLPADQVGLNDRFRIALPTITIPKGKKEGTADIAFSPVNDKLRGTDYVNNNTDGNADNIIDDDLNIVILGYAGGAASFPVNANATPTGSVSFILVDDDKLSTTLTLSADPSSLSKDAGSTDVKVMAILNGSMSKNAESFPLVFDPDFNRDGADGFEPGFGAGADSILTRDAHYGASTASLRIAKRKSQGEGTISIDPKDKVGYIAVAGNTGNTNTTTGLDTLYLEGVDLNADGDTGDSFTGSDFTEAKLDLDINADGTKATDIISETFLGIDLNNDGDTGDTPEAADVIKEGSLKFGVVIQTNTVAVTSAALANVKGDGLAASRDKIREDTGEQTIELTVTLDKAAAKDEEVRFTIAEVLSDPDDTDSAKLGERDRDYIVSVEDLTIAEGETSGKADLTVTPDNNPKATGDRQFTVSATVGGATSTKTITIVDVNTITSDITLSADPSEIKEEAGETVVTITATLDGKTFDEDTKIVLVLDTTPDKSATRDVDYTAIIRSVTIPAGSVSGTTEISITPENDGPGDNDETITIKNKDAIKNEDEEDITIAAAVIKLKDAPAPPEDADVDKTPAFTADDIAASDTVIEGVAGSALEDTVLPEADGDGDLTYSVSANLPAGLAFDSATRTISGTPTAAGTSEIVYTVIDGDTGDDLPAESAALTYTIEIAETPAPTVEIESVSVTTSSVRENGEATEISVKANLAAAAPVSETIRFTIGAPSGGTAAVRDVDYTASIGGTFTVDEGATGASTTMTLVPIDNSDEDGDRSIGVYATASGGSASTDVTIADDETASTSISLSASPHTVGEDAGVTNVTITATLNGKVLDADATVTLSVDGASEATRDVDYSALFNPLLTIPAGQVSGSIVMLIDPTADTADEGNETITLNGEIEGLLDGSGLLTISDVAMDEAAMALMFPEGAMIDDIAATAGTAIAAVELPAASGGSGDIAYSVDGLPAGLSFDPATRMVSGTPEADGTSEVSYMATDSAGGSAMLTFSITVNPMLDFGDLGALFGMFNDGAGKANPADSHDDGALQLTVGVPVNLTLPEIPGGTAPKTYDLAGLPAGLSFDPATRTISGTPSDEGLAVVILTVTDAVGATGQVPFSVSVVHPPLAAPTNLVAEDYKGADGLGDQGGFVMLSWELSEQHDSIDGYRIFRALPVLGNEMVPWAMVDAVPGVSMGRAIVATLDNVSTRWGIASESGGRTTHGAAKAVFVSADNPYELMAETMMASKEAAQAGGPVFASLLPEALAYATGAAPKLNLIGSVSVISSAITMTEEAVRATDDIAPLAVPSLNVLDAPNDQGGRIALTWTLSPSDQLLQGVIAGAIGPTALEPVVGVHGYSIHRRAAGDDEFVNIAQVDAGVTSFVDETALNGVHYTYQVRPYDLDNETVSDIEQTAMAVRNSVQDSEGRAIYGLFGADNHIGFDDFFIFADNFGLTAEDAGFDPAFDLSPSAAIDFDDFFVFADNFGRSIAAAGKRVPMFAGLNADARMYLEARTALPNVGEDFVLDVRLADFAAIKGYGLQVQYEAEKLEFVEVLTDQPLGGSELATPQVLADQAGVLTVAAHGDIVSDGEVMLSLVFRPTTEIENTIIEITDNQTYDGALGFNRLALPVPVQLQTRPEVFSLANNYPNPFNPATTIKYALPQAADVALTVYNVLGQPVRTLVAEHQNAGRYVVEWDATNDSGHSLSSGMYFYRLEAGGDLEVKKMLLLK